MAVASMRFTNGWAVIERGYRRPLAWLSQRLRFAFFPLLALVMLGGLVWDWQHGRKLDAAEDAVFDRIIGWRPLEPVPSGRTVVVEIDDCSIDYFRARGEGGWPWPRERHADLLDALDRAGVRAVGLDILFADRTPDDPGSDALLDAVAAGGEGRFLFAASRLHADFDSGATLHASQVPGAFALASHATPPGPTVALIQPYGDAMAHHSGLVNIRRGSDGVLRDVRLHATAGDWALPSLVLRLAQAAGADTTSTQAARDGNLRINWRTGTRLPYASAADVLAGRPVCGASLPSLEDTVVLLGHTAAGINDAKPTPVDMAMPGVEILAEATEALLSDTWIRMPPAWLKYALATCMVLLSSFVFWRGEPHQDVDLFFVFLNLGLMGAAFAGLTLFGVFIDIFASLGYGALCFGLCRGYAAVQRGRADGNSDYRREYDPATQPWLLLARLCFETDADVPKPVAVRRRREYRRVLRKHVHASARMVMIEGVVERKHWMLGILDDQVLLTWNGRSDADVRTQAQDDLDALHAALNATSERLDGHARVMVCAAATCIDDGGTDNRSQRKRLRALLGQDLDRLPQWQLSTCNTFLSTSLPPAEDMSCQTPSAS